MGELGMGTRTVPLALLMASALWPHWLHSVFISSPGKLDMDVASICCNVLASAFVCGICRIHLSLTPLQAESRRKAFPPCPSRKDKVACGFF